MESWTRMRRSTCRSRPDTRQAEQARSSGCLRRCTASEKINFSYYILLHLITSYSSYFRGKKGISGNKTSFFFLMGLKQAGRKWYDALHAAVTDLGFCVSKADPGVFTACIQKDILILAVHVDDCAMTGNSPKLVMLYKEKLHARYALTDLGPVSWLLGIQVTRDRETQTISLSQEAYIKSIIARFSLAHAKAYSTPMVPSAQYSKSDSPVSATDAACMRKVPYCEAIGSLMYASVATCPDITFAVSTLSQFLENPGEAHWETVKRVFRYLSGTRDVALTYGGERHDLLGFTDADGASQEHCRAISGHAFIMDGGTVSWSSRKQELVTLSTAEAEDR